MINKFNELNKILKKAYAPYSNFFVASIIIPEEKTNLFFKGVNVENSSFGATVCAERSAICSMVTNGFKKIKELHLLTSSKNFIYPCGICRQFISEFITDNTLFFIYNANGKIIKKSFKQIMPYQLFKNKEIK